MAKQTPSPEQPDKELTGAELKQTPMLRQYFEARQQVPDCVLFFRMGDFYEVFFEDAVLCSKVLSIQLTSRDKNDPDAFPMAGVPYRTIDSYVAQLIDAGHKVAICEQVEDPKKAKGLVKRQITQVFSPGTFTMPEHLPAKDNRFLAALCLTGGDAGLAHLDLSSGEFRATVVPPGQPLIDELARLEPAELIVAESQQNTPALLEVLSAGMEAVVSAYSGKPPGIAKARQSLDGRLPEDAGSGLEPALMAAAMAWDTIAATQMCTPEHVDAVSIYQVGTHLVLDATARRNLELYKSIATGSRKGSLLHAVDQTATPMGSRLLKQWLGFPLMDLEAIELRHQAVEELRLDTVACGAIADKLDRLPDVPRLVGRASLGQATPRDLAALRDALGLLPGIIAELEPLGSPLLVQQAAELAGLESLGEELTRTLAERPPMSLADGGVVAQGYSERLDELRAMSSQGKGWIAGLQAQLRAETGIGSLKVGFNRVFGYYIEVTRTHLDKVPDHFIRKQTLATAERYFTPDLKEKEADVLGAEEKALDLEREIFENLRDEVARWARPLMQCGRALAAIDVLSGWAALAAGRDYVRPKMSAGGPIKICQGRHPVVEQMLPAGEFVPNDLHLDDHEQQVIIITGPNMAGKSTILRQAALISLLAQAGSFVPAESAELPLVDRIFTRVGAMDDLARGRSTFMVEMTETAQILKNATPRSLVVLDEVGRGTSTFDGLSLAWAVAEHLHGLHGKGVKTLFATHYHELTELAATCERVRNFNVAVKEYQGQVVFLRRLAPGGVSRSYGLQVARLAGLPPEVLDRARAVLERLETGQRSEPALKPKRSRDHGQMQLFVAQDHPVLERLRGIDPLNMTPIQALGALEELRRLLD